MSSKATYGRTYSSRKSRKTYRRPYKRRSYNKFGYRKKNYPELKFLDTTIPPVNVTNNGTIISSSLNLIDAGTGQSQMLGNKVVIKRINIRFTVYIPSGGNASLSSVINDRNFRLVLILDKQANGSASSIANIFENADYYTYLNNANTKRYTILKEWLMAPPPADVDNDGSIYYHGISSETHKWSHKCNYLLDFSPQVGSNRSINEVTSNNLILAGFTDQSVVSFNARVRIRYIDN